MKPDVHGFERVVKLCVLATVQPKAFGRDRKLPEGVTVTDLIRDWRPALIDCRPHS
jgi:hypothetical protein